MGTGTGVGAGVIGLLDRANVPLAGTSLPANETLKLLRGPVVGGITGITGSGVHLLHLLLHFDLHFGLHLG